VDQARPLGQGQISADGPDQPRAAATPEPPQPIALVNFGARALAYKLGERLMLILIICGLNSQKARAKVSGEEGRRGLSERSQTCGGTLLPAGLLQPEQDNWRTRAGGEMDQPRPQENARDPDK